MITAGMARKFSALVIMTATLLGCSNNRTQLTDYQFYSEADTYLNLDLTERPLSVVLNVYQLRDRQTFARLTFEDFVSGKSDADLLGDDLLSKSEFVVLPGSKQSIDAKLMPDAKFIGVVAAYRMPADQRWRYLIPAQQMRKKSLWGFSEKKTVSIFLRNCYMTVNDVEIDLIPGQRNGTEPTCSSSITTNSVAAGSINQTSASAPSLVSTSDTPKSNGSETADSGVNKARSISETASSTADAAKKTEGLIRP